MPVVVLDLSLPLLYFSLYRKATPFPPWGCSLKIGRFAARPPSNSIDRYSCKLFLSFRIVFFSLPKWRKSIMVETPLENSRSFIDSRFVV